MPADVSCRGSVNHDGQSYAATTRPYHVTGTSEDFGTLRSTGHKRPCHPPAPRVKPERREWFDFALEERPRVRRTNRWSTVEPAPRHVKSHVTAALPLPFSHMCCVIAMTPSLLISNDLSRISGTTVSMKFLINPPCNRGVGARDSSAEQRAPRHLRCDRHHPSQRARRQTCSLQH